MISWRFKRKFIYGFGTVSVLILFIALPIFLLVYEAPTCFDGKQNGTESGVDCGGSCVKLCTAELVAPIVQWTRLFEVSPGVYNTLSMIENPNTNAIGRGGVYTITLFNAQGQVVAERANQTVIPAEGEFPIFTTGLTTSGVPATRATLVFNQQPVWTRLPSGIVKPDLDISKEQLQLVRGTPRLTAEVVNNGTNVVTDLIIIAELVDARGNVINASQTFVERLTPLEAREIAFTWNSGAFRLEQVARISITPVIIPEF